MKTTVLGKELVLQTDCVTWHLHQETCLLTLPGPQLFFKPPTSPFALSTSLMLAVPLMLATPPMLAVPLMLAVPPMLAEPLKLAEPLSLPRYAHCYWSYPNFCTFSLTGI